MKDFILVAGMTKDELLAEIKQTLVKVKVEKLASIAGKSREQINNLIDLSFYPDKAIAFRASWILENAVNTYPAEFLESSLYFLEKYSEQANDSCRRHFTKIMMWLLKKAPERKELENFDWTAIIESTFEWLTDPESGVAVKVNCLDILLALKDREDWIADELKAETEFLMKNGTAAMQAGAKKCLRNS